MDSSIAQVIVEVIGILITILVYIVIYSMTWQKISDRISETEKKITEHEKMHLVLDRKIDSVNEVNVRLARIEVDLAWVKQKLSQE